MPIYSLYQLLCLNLIVYIVNTISVRHALYLKVKVYGVDLDMYRV